jgi:hypothetical protein
MRDAHALSRSNIVERQLPALSMLMHVVTTKTPRPGRVRVISCVALQAASSFGESSDRDGVSISLTNLRFDSFQSAVSEHFVRKITEERSETVQCRIIVNINLEQSS